MTKELLLIDDIFIPQILKIEKEYLIVYKPPGLHSAPLKNSAGDTLFDWCRDKFPDVGKLSGRKKGEGGLLHRLDHETQGLMLIARTEMGMENLLMQQNAGKITKEYCALTMKSNVKYPGFPEKQIVPRAPMEINSAFRPYGIGRKAVRPALQGKKEYATEIIHIRELSNDVFFMQVKIVSGFRHQIRCHLAWMGFPLINDTLYGGSSFGNGVLCLRASSISFCDPNSGTERTYLIPPLEINSFLNSNQ